MEKLYILINKFLHKDSLKIPKKSKENLEQFIFFTKIIYKHGQSESSFISKKILNKNVMHHAGFDCTELLVKSNLTTYAIVPTSR